MNEAKRTGEQERKRITQADILERMRECWELLRITDKRRAFDELPENSLIEYNFRMMQLYIALTEDEKGDKEHLFACGFELNDEDSEEDEG